MFPVSFFPIGYFAPRYFPKYGLDPPGIIRILINGVEVTSRMFYGDATYWNLVRGSRGTCSLPFIVRPDEVFAPQAGEVIEIYDPAINRRFIGTVEGLAVRWLGNDGFRVVTVAGVSYEQLFDSIDIEKVKYTGETCAEAFEDLHTRSGVSVVGLGTIEGSVVIESLEVSNIAQGFAAIALLAGAVWYVDPADANLYLHAPGARAAEWVVASENVLWETMQWRQSRADLRNTQVVQLPGVSMQPIVATFNGDDVETTFTLPSVPEYIISIVISIGSTGRAIAWQPGTAQVTVTPALPTGATLEVRYSDTGLVVSTQPATAAGARTATYTRTRSFTPEGGLQESLAILARYGMLPSELVFSTDKPGIEIARNLLLDLETPIGAGEYVNGHWLVREVDATIIPGLDQREEPWGHFRYTIRLVNTAATAIFQGDGETTTFELPVVPDEVTNIRIGAADREAEWEVGTKFVSIVPALGLGESAAVDYIDPVNVPDVPTFINTWEDLTGPESETPVVLGIDPEELAEEGAAQQFLRTLTLYDLAVGDDIAPHSTVYADGTADRLLVVLRKDLGADLTVRINKGPQFGIEELITVTIPSTTVIDEVLEYSLAQGSPAVLGPFFDKEVLTADILDSDGATDQNGIVQLTVQWSKVG